MQVHPGDEYAFTHENGEFGKTEMWYVIAAEPGAQLVYGVKPGVTREQFEQGIRNGNLEEYLNYVDVKAGDVFHIPATNSSCHWRRTTHCGEYSRILNTNIPSI